MIASSLRYSVALIPYLGLTYISGVETSNAIGYITISLRHRARDQSSIVLTSNPIIILAMQFLQLSSRAPLAISSLACTVFQMHSRRMCTCGALALRSPSSEY
eukprot:6212048-Pleurochrysis_carterae.AAC.6